jgi:hypothetical protein
MKKYLLFLFQYGKFDVDSYAYRKEQAFDNILPKGTGVCPFGKENFRRGTVWNYNYDSITNEFTTTIISRDPKYQDAGGESYLDRKMEEYGWEKVLNS